MPDRNGGTSHLSTDDLCEPCDPVMSCRPPALSPWGAAAVVAGLLLLVAVAPASAGGPGWETAQIEAMSTVVTLSAPAGEAIERARPIVEETLHEVEERMNEWREGTPLAELNLHAGAGPTAMPDDLRALIRRGLALGRRTHGAFDISWAALWGLWDFRAASPRLPAAAEVKRRLERVDYRRVAVDDVAGTVTLPKGTVLGLGGLAKGHAAVVAGARLRKAGLRSWMISLGGQVEVSGGKDGRLWRVGIRDPRGPATDYFAIVELIEGSVSTSGDYERYFELGGRRYHHILDPKTGYPSRGVRSATVIARAPADAADADALSTALVVLGVERGLELAEQWKGVEAVMVDSAGKVHMTSGAKALVTVTRAPRGD